MHLLDFYRECWSDLSSARRRYIARGIAKILVSQFKIYLSFPADRERRAQIQKLDEMIRSEYPEVYRSVSNKAVKVLRISGYHLYGLASAICRRAYHCMEGEKE